MEIRVNGKTRDLVDTKCLVTDLLKLLGIDPQQSGMAVAINMSVIPRSNWDSSWVKSGDEVEVISAHQGG